MWKYYVLLSRQCSQRESSHAISRRDLAIGLCKYETIPYRHLKRFLPNLRGYVTSQNFIGQGGRAEGREMKCDSSVSAKMATNLLQAVFRRAGWAGEKLRMVAFDHDSKRE